MKRYLRIILYIFLLLITTAACGKEEKNHLSDENEIEVDGNSQNKDTEMKKMNLTIGNRVLTVSLVENSSADSLTKALDKKPIVVEMRDYGNMEKVGPLGQNFPRNDTQITTEAGDIILYQGNMLVIYYAPNSWSFTRIGKIEDVSAQELINILGNGNVTVTLSLPTK